MYHKAISKTQHNTTLKKILLYVIFKDKIPKNKVHAYIHAKKEVIQGLFDD